MRDELTKVDIDKINEEINYRKYELAPKLREEMSEARAQGDLSENYEYKVAKRALNRNYGRIRYLERLRDTAIIVETNPDKDVIGLFDRVTLYLEEDEEEIEIELVTTLRNNIDRMAISKESPIGRAVFGKRVGDRIYVTLDNGSGYYCVVRKIEKGEDDTSLPISSY